MIQIINSNFMVNLMPVDFPELPNVTDMQY